MMTTQEDSDNSLVRKLLWGTNVRRELLRQLPQRLFERLDRDVTRERLRRKTSQ